MMMADEEKKIAFARMSVTVGQLAKFLNKAISNKIVKSEDLVLWAKEVNEGSEFQYEYGCAPGSLLFGIFDTDEGYGTLRIEPAATSKFLS